MSESQELLRASLLAYMTFLQPTNAILNVLSLRNNCKTSGVFQLMEGRLNHIRFWNATLNPCNQQNHLNSHPSSAGSNTVIRDNQISLCKFRLMVRVEAVNSAILNSDFLSTSLHSLWWWTIKYFAIEAQPCIYFKKFKGCILFLTTYIFRKQANIIPKPTKQVLPLLLLWLIQMVYLTFLCSLNRFHFWRFMTIAFYLIDLICSFP